MTSGNDGAVKAGLNTLTGSPVNVFWLLLAVALLLFGRTVADMVGLWTDSGNPTYSHGVLLVVVCGFILVRQWRELSPHLHIRIDATAVVGLAGLSLGWFVAVLASVQVVEHVALVLITALLPWALFGRRAASALLFPLLLMLTAVPIWDVLPMPLQKLTAAVVGQALNAGGITTFVDGVVLNTPRGAFEVARGCSGLGQFVVAVTVALLYAYQYRIKPRFAVALIAAAMAVAVLINIVRIYIVAVAGYMTYMEHVFVQHHYMLGWVLFGLAMFAFLFLVSRYGLERMRRPVRAPSIAAAASPDERSRTAGALRRYYTPVGLGLVTLAIALGPALSLLYQFRSNAMPPVEAGAYIAPADLPGWRSLGEAPSSDWHPTVRGADRSLAVDYSDENGQRVQLRAYLYRDQRPGKEAVQFANRVYDGERWDLMQQNRRVRPAVNTIGSTVTVSRLRSRAGAEKLVWQWYEVDGYRTSQDVTAKLLNLWGMLTGSPQISYVAVATDIAPRPDRSDAQAYDRARARLTRFTKAWGDTAPPGEPQARVDGESGRAMARGIAMLAATDLKQIKPMGNYSGYKD